MVFISYIKPVFIHLFIHLFTNTEYLLGARHCSRYWGYRSEQDDNLRSKTDHLQTKIQLCSPFDDGKPCVILLLIDKNSLENRNNCRFLLTHIHIKCSTCSQGPMLPQYLWMGWVTLFPRTVLSILISHLCVHIYKCNSDFSKTLQPVHTNEITITITTLILLVCSLDHIRRNLSYLFSYACLGAPRASHACSQTSFLCFCTPASLILSAIKATIWSNISPQPSIRILLPCQGSNW